MVLVVDASVACAWVFEDERDDAADLIGLEVARVGAFVPGLFWEEIANVLLQSQRQRRVSRQDAEASLRRLVRLDLTVSGHRPTPARLLDLGSKHALTAYDAVYLDLALELGADLATLDADLRAAAQAEGVRALPDPAGGAA
jgi:predicted nucleic acid-binding protein